MSVAIDDCDADAADAVRCTRNAVDAADGVDTMDPSMEQTSSMPMPMLRATRPQIVRPPPRNRCVAASPSPHLQRGKDIYV